MKNPRVPILALMAALVLAVAPQIWAEQASPNSGSMGGMGRMMGGGMVLMAAGGIALVVALIALAIFLVRRSHP